MAGGADGGEQNLAGDENANRQCKTTDNRNQNSIVVMKQPERAPDADGKWQRECSKLEHQPNDERAAKKGKNDGHGRPFETRLPPPPQRDCAGI